MEKTRLEFLEDALRAQPENAFARYGLAMELQSVGRLEEAWRHFDLLIKQHPDYAATYYQAGTLLAKLNRREESQRVLALGIEVTGKQGNQHARSELQAALDDLLNDV